MRRRAFAGLAAVLVVAAVYWHMVQPPPEDGWHEITWPFPRDAWPAGLAFQCGSPSCGGALRVFVRPKRGFCANCAAGVTDDAEVDGVADLDMMAANFIPAEPGEAVGVGAMQGRWRSYLIQSADGRWTPAVGMAMTRRKQCDLIVAAAEGPDAQTARKSINSLLASDKVATWIDQQLEGR